MSDLSRKARQILADGDVTISSCVSQVRLTARTTEQASVLHYWLEMESEGFPSANEFVFCRRLSDGKFYRGARWWRWTRSWRMAAALRTSYWRGWIIGRKIKDRVELVTLSDLCLEEVHNG